MPLNKGPSDVTGCKFSSHGSDGARRSVKIKTKILAEELDRRRQIHAAK